MPDRGVMFQYFEWNLRPDGSLWRELASRAAYLKRLGVTAVWMPPAHKTMDGATGVGYAVYDLYDLGEFDQKGSVRTKYGTKDEYLAAIQSLHDNGIHAYADIVLNHRMGADETEEVEVEEVDCNNRNVVTSKPYKIRAWSNYLFPGRGDAYSPFKLHWQHFNAFGADANQPDVKGKIFRVVGKTFAGDVCYEFGNFDYLMGADVDHYHEEVRAELSQWGDWFVDITKIDGFRCDAIKHIPASFFKQWLADRRLPRRETELFAVGEYWHGDIAELQKYLAATEGAMHLFDVPLHFRFLEASQKGRDFPMPAIFDKTLVKENPLMAVTFVDNHDSQPGQSLESWVADWFKPLAYALILLRKDGYPCLFYGDYFGNADPAHPLVSHRKLIDDFLTARAKYSYGDQHDYFDHAQCIGWTFTGDKEHSGQMAVLMSTGDAGMKTMKTFRGEQTFTDITGHWPEPITTNANGEAEFKCPAGKVSVWVSD
ncbi:MAG: alpha-amylase [Phycisphaerales bacterium]|nr:alpha-amylase [Phycisphaerales bacterium]